MLCKKNMIGCFICQPEFLARLYADGLKYGSMSVVCSQLSFSKYRQVKEHWLLVQTSVIMVKL